ncbi:general substrate transporter [Lipomyces tetrasporus]
MECFRRKNLKRTITAIFAASGQQLIGATFVTGYATYFFELINIQNYFLASCILYAVMLLASGAVFILSETLGRRTLIVPSLFVLCLLLLIIGIMGCLPNQVTAGWVIVVLIYIWAIIYQISIGATGFVLASEVATLRLRGVTQALVTVSNAVWGLIMQFTIPYMINTDAGNLGGKTGFIFFGTGTITAVVAYFLFPETKGISFDRLDELYAAGVKPRHFKTLAYATDLNPGIRDCESGDNGATDLKSVHYAMEKGEK